MTTSEIKLLSNIKNGLEYLMSKGKEELSLQGHKNTGALERSFESVVKIVFNRVVGSILVNDYGIKLDQIQKPGDLGDFSTHYREILGWAADVHSDFSKSELQSFAYSTSANQFVVGIPLPGAYDFSQNGRRTEWIKYSLEDDTNLSVFFELINIEEIFNIAIAEAINEINQLRA